jgi:hypothetical protein
MPELNDRLVETGRASLRPSLRPDQRQELEKIREEARDRFRRGRSLAIKTS